MRLPAFLALGLVLTTCVAHAQSPVAPSADHGSEAAVQRQKLLAAEAARMVAVAQTLKVSVEATRKDELSLDVVRKADEIEKMAKAVKDRPR